VANRPYRDADDVLEAGDIAGAVELNVDTWLGPDADEDAFATQLPDLLTDARHVDCPWAGHLPSLERPPAVTELLVGFLEEVLLG
jgi:pimeloyl-ACP methyl ester carboxylesterase